MSNYNAIQEVGATLVDLLWKNFKKDSHIKMAILQSKNDIKVDSISNIENSGRLTLFLYRIEPNPEMRNRGMELRYNGDSHHTLVQPPLPLDLYYMIIPHTQTIEKDHVLLGKVMHVFYDNAILDDSILIGSLKGSGQKLRIVPFPMDTEEVFKLWSLFKDHDHRLCISYLLTPIILESSRVKPTCLVKEDKLTLKKIDKDYQNTAE